MSSLRYRRGPVTVLSVPSRKELARLSTIRSGFPLLEKAFTYSGCVADNDSRLKEGGEEPFLEK